MIVLKILGGFFLIAAMVFVVLSFDEHCKKKFSYRLFTMVSFIAAAIGVWSILGGHAWYQHSLLSGSDILNGILIMTIGSAFVVFLGYYNFRRAGVLYGISGTVLQLGLFALLSYLSLFFAIMGLVIVICLFLYNK